MSVNYILRERFKKVECLELVSRAKSPIKSRITFRLKKTNFYLAFAYSRWFWTKVCPSDYRLNEEVDLADVLESKVPGTEDLIFHLDTLFKLENFTTKVLNEADGKRKKKYRANLNHMIAKWKLHEKNN